MRITKSVNFDAAHMLADAVPLAPSDHPYKRVHGHSFVLKVTVEGEPDPAVGWVVDFDDVTAALGRVREKLDHQYLNEIEGLEVPTLENICLWVAKTLRPDLPGLTEVEVSRPSIGEACVYTVSR